MSKIDRQKKLIQSLERKLIQKNETIAYLKTVIQYILGRVKDEVHKS
jgi:hypothetical protein